MAIWRAAAEAEVARLLSLRRVLKGKVVRRSIRQRLGANYAGWRQQHAEYALHRLNYPLHCFVCASQHVIYTLQRLAYTSQRLFYTPHQLDYTSQRLAYTSPHLDYTLQSLPYAL